MKPNTIALCVLLTATVLMIFLFAESRGDPSLRLAALVAALSLVASLAAIGSTILTGKDLTKHDAPDSQNPTPPADPATTKK